MRWWLGTQYYSDCIQTQLLSFSNCINTRVILGFIVGVILFSMDTVSLWFLTHTKPKIISQNTASEGDSDKQVLKTCDVQQSNSFRSTRNN